jgi:glycosyltransferase involved in cell wall biosynthesis
MYSVVIPSRNIANLQACISSVRRCEPYLQAAQIIVVDDDETGQIEQYCTAYEFTRVQGQKPFVFARNANLGLHTAFAVPAASAAILLNDDALLETHYGFMDMVAVALSEHWGLLAPATTNTGNLNQEFKGSASVRREHRMLCFVCVVIPLAIWLKVGELDERYTGYGLDDDDYSLRVRRAGFGLGVYDRCRVNHNSLVSSYRGAAGAGGDFTENLERFKEKWGVDNFGRPA